ncbi:hypothetical protein B0H11DRAFT_2220355 [Mycena galericulata]|nr:hypothetical protein B0H11DRAFT_2220355 [Mycena galericulata]
MHLAASSPFFSQVSIFPVSFPSTTPYSHPSPCPSPTHAAHRSGAVLMPGRSIMQMQIPLRGRCKSGPSRILAKNGPLGSFTREEARRMCSLCRRVRRREIGIVGGGGGGSDERWTVECNASMFEECAEILGGESVHIPRLRRNKTYSPLRLRMGYVRALRKLTCIPSAPGPSRPHFQNVFLLVYPSIHVTLMPLALLPRSYTPTAALARQLLTKDDSVSPCIKFAVRDAPQRLRKVSYYPTRLRAPVGRRLDTHPGAPLTLRQRAQYLDSHKFSV